MRLYASKILTVVAAALAAATLTVSSGSGNAGSSTPSNHVVEIRDFKFAPSSLTIRQGDSVEWINRDIVPHTATGNNKAWDTKKLGKGQSGRITFSTVGQEEYLCRFHQTMRGKIIISVK